MEEKINYGGTIGTEFVNALSDGAISDPLCALPRLEVRNPHPKLLSKIVAKRVHIEE